MTTSFKGLFFCLNNEQASRIASMTVKGGYLFKPEPMRGKAIEVSPMSCVIASDLSNSCMICYKIKEKVVLFIYYGICWFGTIH